MNDDNIYPVGQVISAKENPEVKLIIRRYFQRIYYCRGIDDPSSKDLAYFERELVPPIS